MSIPKIPDPARLVVSILAARSSCFEEIRQELVGSFGPVADMVGPMDFDYTNYYDEELGSPINRWLLAFEDLVDCGRLMEIKELTNTMEQTYTVCGKRKVNLDPGLLTLGNFVLATGKNNAHRIYLGVGIFADLTLVYRSGSFRRLEWTYPDYADPSMISILNTIRESYKCKLGLRGIQMV
jgi:hypothetical protein